MATEPPLLPVPPPVVPETLRLEILKTLQTASFNRWEKRRNYEWLLSYAIWFGLAGFIAFVALGKDTQFKPPESWGLTVAVFACILVIHAGYLFFMTDGTIRDLHAQRLIETAMCDMTHDIQLCNDFKLTQHFGSKERSESLKWWIDRHGLVAQVLITSILCVFASWTAVMRPKPAIEPSNIGTYCQSCTQYLAPTQSQAVRPEPTRSSVKPGHR